jgi:hypothetical protein
LIKGTRSKPKTSFKIGYSKLMDSKINASQIEGLEIFKMKLELNGKY